MNSTSLTLILISSITMSSAESSEALSYQTVVTGNRTGESELETPRSIDSIDASELIEEQPSSLPDALRQSPGVHLQETNRGAGAPIIRGFVGPQNGIRVDGIRFDTATFRTGPNQYLALNDPYSLSRVEVLRGPSSVLYGSGAMGGIIQLLTADFSFNPIKRISLWHQSADQGAGIHAAFSRTDGALSYLGSASAQIHGQLRNGNNTFQPLSSFEQGHWLGKSNYKISEAWNITTAYLGTRIQNAGRIDQLGRGDIRFYSNDDHFVYLRSVHRLQSPLKEVEATLSFHRLDETIQRFTCSKNDNGVVESLVDCIQLKRENLNKERHYNDRVDSLGMQLDSRWSFASGRIRLLAGAETYLDSVDSKLNTGTSSNLFDMQEQERGNFSSDSWFLSTGFFINTVTNLFQLGENGRIRASAGLRFSSFSAHAPKVPGIGDVDYSFSGLVSSASLQWIHGKLSNLYFSFNQGFRAPNLQESTVLGDTGSKFEIPNDQLKPESANSYELGLRIHAAFLQLHTALFYTQLKDTISESPASYNAQDAIDGKPVVQRINAGSGTIQGVESALIIPWGNFALDLGASLTLGDIKAPDGTTTPMRRSPPLTATAGLRYSFPSQKGSLRFYAQAAAAAERLHPSDLKDLRICETAPYSGVLSAPCSGTQSWATLNLTASWQLNASIKSRIAILNITDETYRWHGSGFDRPGFNSRIMLEGSF